jgi:hypothetical protein
MRTKRVIRGTLKSAARSRNRALISLLAASLAFCYACGGGSAAREVKLGRESRGRKVEPVTISSVAPEPVTLESVNRRWGGARCQIRTAVEIKKDRDKAGWSKSDWLRAPVLPGEKAIRIRLWVSDRDALAREGYLRRNTEVRPGTAFIATGWRFADPSKKKGIVFDLRFEALPVKARMEFKGADQLEDLEDAEQLARIELFQLHEGSQQSASSSESPSSRSAGPTITVVSAAVEPKLVRRGGEVELLITYTVGGGSQAAVQVSETRELRKGESNIGTFSDTKTRVPGTYTSSRKIQVTPTTPAGSYTFRALVSIAGTSSEASTSFEVR